MGTHFVGLTCFHVRAEEPFVEEMKCGLCGETCNVKREAVGATSWGMAMGQGKVKHDFFSCPNIDEKWHEQALDIFRESLLTKTLSIKAILEKDIAKIIKSKKAIL